MAVQARSKMYDPMLCGFFSLQEMEGLDLLFVLP